MRGKTGRAGERGYGRNNFCRWTQTRPPAVGGKTQVSSNHRHQSDHQDCISRNVHVEIQKGMDENGNQSEGGTHHKSELITARSSAEIARRETDGPPCLNDAHTQKYPSARHQSRTGYTPIGKRIQVVIMRPVGTQLHPFRPISLETRVKVSRPYPPPGVVFPHQDSWPP